MTVSRVRSTSCTPDSLGVQRSLALIDEQHVQDHPCPLGNVAHSVSHVEDMALHIKGCCIPSWEFGSSHT